MRIYLKYDIHDVNQLMTKKIENCTASIEVRKHWHTPNVFDLWKKQVMSYLLGNRLLHKLKFFGHYFFFFLKRDHYEALKPLVRDLLVTLYVVSGQPTSLKLFICKLEIWKCAFANVFRASQGL